jgi:hypothetical protein
MLLDGKYRQRSKRVKRESFGGEEFDGAVLQEKRGSDVVRR